MKVEGAPRFLKAFWNPEVSWILRSPRGLSRIALISESITSGGPWAPALILQGVHCPLPPALCPQVGFICPMSALKQPPASTLLSKHLCLQQCLVGLGGLFWSCKVHREGHTTEHQGFDIHPPPLTTVFLPSVLTPVYSLPLPSPYLPRHLPPFGSKKGLFYTMFGSDLLWNLDFKKPECLWNLSTSRGEIFFQPKYFSSYGNKFATSS